MQCKTWWYIISFACIKVIKKVNYHYYWEDKKRKQQVDRQIHKKQYLPHLQIHSLQHYYEPVQPYHMDSISTLEQQYCTLPSRVPSIQQLTTTIYYYFCRTSSYQVEWTTTTTVFQHGPTGFLNSLNHVQIEVLTRVIGASGVSFSMAQSIQNGVIETKQK